jgi:hypothetical protein
MNGLSLALAGFETALRFVDHVQATTTADDTVIAMTGPERLDRILNFHGTPVSNVC